MIKPGSQIVTLNQFIKLFDISLPSEEESRIVRICEPIKNIFLGNQNSSLNVFKDGSTFHAEAIVKIGSKYVKAQSIDFGLTRALEKLIPKLIKSVLGDNHLDGEIMAV